MATIYKRSRDAEKKNVHWWIQYFDHERNRRTKKVYTDKRKTEAKAAKLEEEARLRRDGLIDPNQEKAKLQRETPLCEHLAAFERKLKKNSPKHLKPLATMAQGTRSRCGALSGRLGKRRTGLMVKKDLKRVGIPYRDEQGLVADFHAAGRHTHLRPSHDGSVRLGQTSFILIIGELLFPQPASRCPAHRQFVARRR